MNTTGNIHISYSQTHSTVRNTSTILEGNAKLVVPSDSLTSSVPPRHPAFFNPNAKMSRDFSVIAYHSVTKNLNEKSIADALAGVGARAIRAAAEVNDLEEVWINDTNQLALEMARESSKINGVEKKCKFSENEVCKFLIEHSSRGARFGIVDLDPFGTPAPYIDCALRALDDGGLLSVTATDTPVLCGIYPDVCLRRYYGRSINVEYGNEIGLRLVLGLISKVASRLEMGITPLFAHSTRNYLRVYAKTNVNSQCANEMPSKLGYIYHCFSCGNRTSGRKKTEEEVCEICGKRMKFAGPLWIENISDKGFVDEMLLSVKDCSVDKRCNKLISLSMEEIVLPPTYYVVDRISERLRAAPPTILRIIEKLQSCGFLAARTSLKDTGFRTNAGYSEVLDLFRTLVV